MTRFGRQRTAIRAIVFDVGGVLELTTEPTFMQEWETNHGLEPKSLSDGLGHLWESGNIGGISLDEVHRGIGEATGLDDTTVNAFLEDLWTWYLGTLNVELYDYFRTLRPRYQTAILSNSFVGAREREQEAYRLSDSCDLIIYSHEVGMSKPDPRIYELTCERLGVKPTEMIFVDDVEANVVAARSLDIRGIQFHTNQQVIADIRALTGAQDGDELVD